ncbi:cell division cycle protein 27 homolog B-like isoform X1 [Chenopodium quinoa]|uniref:cell division cycle protein 27 homolog B-like isoform X1 n=1 Tax=Chenopodium quinoa TaxID=63459 RepID=UPI000B797144|nr:cell division cycle protein 27 homolog B-like isoform X1 [Chenopodium quinoa]XP_021775799.1 cell division cycle protein 27 homolog B-like isoform X1 [Chenopodium quinoa]
MEAILVDSVQNSLRHFMYSNAIFICERLCAEFPTEVNWQLLANCYLRNNQAYAAYNILKGKRMAQSRYLFAFSCFHMDLLNEAEKALSPANDSGLEVPNDAAGHYLLGLIYRYTDRRKSAVHHFKQALSIDPLFWAAYEELCILGSAEEASAVFGDTAAHTIQKQLQHAFTSQSFVISTEDQNQVSAKSCGDASPRQLKSIHGNSAKDASGSYQGANVSSVAVSQSLNYVSSSLSFYNTPSPMASQMSGVAPPPVCRHVQQTTAPASSESSPRSTVGTTLLAPRRKVLDEGKLRKISGRLFSDSIPRRNTRLSGDAGGSTNTTTTSSTGNGTTHSLKNAGSSRLGNVGLRSVTLRKGQAGPNESFEEGNRHEAFSDSRFNTQASISTSSFSDAGFTEQDGGSMNICRNIPDDSEVHNGALEILGLWRLLGDGFRLSCMYKCQDALEIYKKLPYKHYSTGWVLSQVGRAYFELVDYLEADRAFSLARRQCPCSLDGMDVYSTVLYHLKEDMKLSYLAQELLSIDRLAPQTWCAMGNCYSLQKDHDTALKNFQRAVQLNSRFAYAHTLCGHELVALEDFESGIKSFQNALRVDSRHYNAWYGLGMVYLRQEKFEFAEHHFQVAFKINPHSSVIMSYLGTALHALRRNEEALAMMEKAILADKKNPLPMYQKAIVLSGMDNYDEALRVLEELKEYAPRECSIYALIGKIYKRKNMYDKAMLHFGLALDLKPSATDVATIKAAIEKLHVPDDLDDIL